MSKQKKVSSLSKQKKVSSLSKLVMYCHKFAASEEKKVLIDVFGKSSLLETREETDKDYNVLKDVEENEVEVGAVTLEGHHWAKEESLLWIIFLTRKPKLSKGTEFLQQTLVFKSLHLCNPLL